MALDPNQLAQVQTEIAQAQLSLARQQVVTAWVAAGAAAVQAIGAVLAIWFSVKIARDAAKREQAAEAASIARAEAAERRADERLKEATQAEERRMSQTNARARNARIERVLGLLRDAKAAVHLDGVRMKNRVVERSRGSVEGRYDHKALRDLRDGVAQVIADAPDPDLIPTLQAIQQTARARDTGALAITVDRHVAYLSDLELRLAGSESALAELRIPDPATT